MTGTNVPVLETERLVLRGHTLEDFPAYAAMWADPQVTKFIGGKPFSEEEDGENSCEPLANGW
jgi:RimJ/RimL family protein N-acetyltransferase